MSASRKAGYYWVKYVSQNHWSIEYWNGGMWFTRNSHLVEDSMFSTIDETPIVREQKESEQQCNCNLPNVSISLPSDDIVREAANNYAFNRYYEQENPYDTTVTDFEEGIKWIYRYIKRQ